MTLAMTFNSEHYGTMFQTTQTILPPFALKFEVKEGDDRHEMFVTLQM